MEALRYVGLVEEEETGKFSPKMRSMFLFKSPEAFFSFIDHILMLISFYWALWVVNFAYSTNQFYEPDRSAWKVYSLLPAIGCTLVFIYVVRSSYLLKVSTSYYLLIN
jgi:hypothetical protein